MTTNIFFDGITGEFLNDEIEIQEVDTSYEVTFENRFKVNFGENVKLLCFDAMKRSSVFSLDQLTMMFNINLSVPNCSELEQYWGMTNEERESLLEYMLGVADRVNNYLTTDDLQLVNSIDGTDYDLAFVERLVNSLGYSTGMFKATRKNKSGRFIQGEMIDAIRFSKELMRGIKSVELVNKKGYNFVRKSGEPKLVVCSGVTLVPFYI